MKWALCLAAAAIAAYGLSYGSLWKCCDKASERERQDSKRWAVIWLIASMLLGIGSGAQMVKQFDKQSSKILDGVVHQH